jgi:4-amino-4-deoxy-L-arabinose transferase-like glycosyltransferase
VRLFLNYKTEALFILIALIIYFIFRIPNLTSQPIFADEAIYIRWAQVMKSEPTLRFISVQDGKTPLFMWAMTSMFKFFDDPLFAGRILSIFSGSLTLLGVYLLSRLVFGKKAAIFATIFYISSPLIIFFDRMALVDSMLSAFTIWSLYLLFLIIRSPRFDLAMILGYLLGGGLLVKTPAMMNLLMLPISLIAFSYQQGKRSKLLRFLICLIIAVLIAMVMYNLLRLGPNFSQLSSRNEDYIFSVTEIMKHPLDPFLPHFKDLLDVFYKMLTLPIFLLILFGAVLLIHIKNKNGLAILVWAILPILIQLAFLKVFTARYILFSIPPLLVIAGFGMSWLTTKTSKKTRTLSTQNIVSITLLLLVIFQSLYFDWLIINEIQKAPLPLNERKGYLEEWTAGYKFKEIAGQIREKRKTQTVVVGTEGFFGTLPDGIRIYLDNTDISFVGSTATISAQMRTAAKDHFTYFIANKNRLAKPPTNAILLNEYPKAKPLDNSPQDFIVVYQVLDAP